MLRLDYTNPAPHVHDLACENRDGEIACGQTPCDHPGGGACYSRGFHIEPCRECGAADPENFGHFARCSQWQPKPA